MSQVVQSYATWLADYYLLATALLAAAIAGMGLLKQPVQRLAVSKSTLVALLLLASLCAVPGWSAVHLLTAERPQPTVREVPREVSLAPPIMAERIRPIEMDGPLAVRPQTPVLLSETAPPPPSPPLRIHWPTVLAIAHLAGAAAIAVWLTLGWFASARLRRTAQPAPSETLAILKEVATAQNAAGETMRLLTHDGIDVAVALGIWRPTIMLPTRWIHQIPLPFREGPGEGSTRDHLRSVLAHESTHILNRDLQWVAVARVLLIVLWANPLFWIARRSLRLDQEALADAAAAELTSRQRYAEQLVAWAREVRRRPAMHLSSAVGLWEGPSQLRQRIAILLNDRFTVLRNCSRRWRLAAAAIAIGAATTLSMVTIQPGQSAPNGEAKDNSATPKSTQSTGTLLARFVFDGTPPKPKKLPPPGLRMMDSDRVIPDHDGARIIAKYNVHDESLIVGSKGGVANVFVWVRSKHIPSPAVSELSPLTLSFKNGRFVPHALAFQAPRKLIFRNEEEKAACNFNYPTGAVNPLVVAGNEFSFTAKPAPLPSRVNGNIQTWLGAWLFPVAHPYFAVSDENGTARIKDLPPGKWEFQVWHEQRGYLKTADWPMGRFTLDIKPGDNDLGTIKLPAKAFEVAMDDRSPVQFAEHHQDTADGSPTSKLDNAKGNSTPPPMPMDSLSVRVTNDADKPIKGAKVSPYGMRSGNNGAHYGWFGDMPGVDAPVQTSTGDDGIAMVRYPRFVGEKRPVDTVSLQVSHPDYVATTKDVSVKDSPSSIRLARGGVVEIRVDSREKLALEELFGLGPTGSIGWSRTKEGTLRSPHLGVGSDEEWARPVGPAGPAGTEVATAAGQHVRAVWLPKNRPAQFSMVASVQVREGETKLVRLELLPGTRLTGKLDAAVPRPVVGGKVVAVVDSPGYTDWYDWVPVKEDGTFEFLSLPREQNVQIMALCDGFISAPGAANDNSRLTPQMVPLGRDTVNHDIKMIPTATADVKLRDPQGQPVRGAKVSFCPNIFWSMGSNIVGQSLCRSSDMCPDPDYLAKTRKRRPEFPFTAVSDDKGVARVTNLPPFPDSMQVQHERFQLPESNGTGGGQRFFNDFKLQPGKTTEAEVTLQPKEGAAAADGKLKAETEHPAEKDGAQPAAAKTGDSSGDDHAPTASVFIAAISQPGTPNAIAGQFVDENGKPLANVKVVLARVWYQDATRREIVAKQITQADGKFRFDKVVDIAHLYPNGKIPKLPDFAGPCYQVSAHETARVSQNAVIAQNEVALRGSTINVKMPPAATLRGRITGPTGEPVAGALVSIGFSQMDRWEGFQTARTGADGRYEIADAPKYDAKNEERIRGLGASNGEDYLVITRSIFVEHSNFASRYAQCEKIPGTQDVQLKSAAVITGRVVDGDTKQPIGSARVQVFSSQPNSDIEAGTHFGLTNTDAQGNYRISTLPTGTYDLWAEAPTRVNKGLKKLVTSSERVTAAPDLVMSNGGTVRVRLVDSKSRKPLALQGNERAQVQFRPSPPLSASAMVEAMGGRFQFRALPGENQIHSVFVTSDDAVKWILRPSETITVRVTEGKSTDVDLPVQEIDDVAKPGSSDAPVKSGAPAGSTDKKSSEQTTPDNRIATPATNVADTNPTELVGRVEDLDGKPLAGVTVDAWTWYNGNETTTDKRGRFRLKGFDPNEEVEIEFRKKDLCPRLFVNERAGTPDWVVKMDSNTYLEGQLTDRDSKAVANTVIRADRGPFQNPQVSIGEVTTQTRTDKDGHYRLYLEPDTYLIKIRAPGRGVARYDTMVLTSGEKKQLDIRLDEGVTFRAKVLDSMTDKPVEGIVLWNWTNRGIEGASNADGILEIQAMFPGKFEFNVSAVGANRTRDDVAGKYARWWSAEAVKDHQRKVQSDRHGFQRNFDDLEFDVQKDAAPVTIYVEPCVTITGRVVDPDGKPVAGSTVAPAKTGSGNSLTGDTRFSYETKSDGTFEMKMPASGLSQYNLVAHDGKYQQFRKWANGAGKPFSTLPGDRLEKIELRLTRPATIRGQVLSDTGEPVVGKDVRAADAEKRDNRYYVPTIKTDNQGKFELKFVGPGKHYVQVEPFWLDADQAPEGTSIMAEVKEGETIDGVLIAPAVVRSDIKAKETKAVTPSTRDKKP